MTDQPLLDCRFNSKTPLLFGCTLKHPDFDEDDCQFETELHITLFSAKSLIETTVTLVEMNVSTRCWKKGTGWIPFMDKLKGSWSGCTVQLKTP